MNAIHRFVRIIAVPPGEAPLWVREKWVGLELPLAWRARWARLYLTSGVLTGPRNSLALLWRLLAGRLQRERGYPVAVADALAVLERTAPEAASWWREHAPRLLTRRRTFLFHASACELVARVS